MSYENAPATILLATHCAVCRRPLCDARSVEIGMGPDCREKYGFNEAVGEEERTTANKIVHELATLPNAPSVETVGRISALRALGLRRLASVLEERLSVVTISETEQGRLEVHSRYDAEFVEALRRIPGRRWNRDAKTWTVPHSSRGALWSALRHRYGGQIGRSARGVFAIPAFS